jgi:hypothetical protein
VVADDAAPAGARQFFVGDEVKAEQERVGVLVEGFERIGGERERPRLVGDRAVQREWAHDDGVADVDAELVRVAGVGSRLRDVDDLDVPGLVAERS